MKKLFLLATMCVALTACEKMDVAEIENKQEQTEQTKKFTFTVKGNFAPLEGTRASSQYMVADGVEMKDLWVVDVVNGSIVQELHQTPADDAWGEPQMQLSLGTHHILFLASRGNEPIYANGRVTWSKPLDSFYKDYEVTVVKTSNGNRAVTLDRCATKMQLNIQDAIPEGTTTMLVTPTTWYNGFNMLQGAPIAVSDYLYTFSIPASWIGQTGAQFTMWSLSGKEEWQTAMSIESKAGTTQNASALITDIPMQTNRATIYGGNLYSNAGDMKVALNTDWLTPYNGEW